MEKYEGRLKIGLPFLAVVKNFGIIWRNLLMWESVIMSIMGMTQDDGEQLIIDIY